MPDRGLHGSYYLVETLSHEEFERIIERGRYAESGQDLSNNRIRQYFAISEDTVKVENNKMLQVLCSAGKVFKKPNGLDFVRKCL